MGIERGIVVLVFVFISVCDIVCPFRFVLPNIPASTFTSPLRSATRWMIPSNSAEVSITSHNGNNGKELTSNRRGLPKELQIIISGAPAAGKGTQCEFIKSNFGVVHISTGELLRSAMRDNSDLGNHVRAYMDAGKLVPDNIIIDVVCSRLSQQDCQQRGWLLDGFPRTKAQADALFRVGHIADCFILLDVAQSILLDRITGRRTDPITGKVYHLTHNPPLDPEVQKRIVQRSDDTAEKLVARYADYQAHTGAIRSYYEDKMVTVDGSGNKDSIRAHISDVLSKIRESKNLLSQV